MMIDDLLVPERTLVDVDPESLRKHSGEDPLHAIDVADQIYGKAYLRYRIFADWCSQFACCESLSEERQFYNRYYWFLKFSKLFASVHGRDVGLEQQAFQMLETSMSEVDWSVIEQIELRIAAETVGD